MRIFFPTCSFYPADLGGPVKTLLWHTEALNDRGIDISILTTDRGLEGQNVILDRFHKTNFGRIRYSSRNKILSIIKHSFVNIYSSDIVHLNSLFCYASIINFILLCLFFQRTKIVWSVRGELADSALAYSYMKKKVFLNFYKLFQRRITFHATSDKESELISKHFPKAKKIQLPNFIKGPERELGVTKLPRILFLGRIHPIKRIENLVLAAKDSSAFIENKFELLIVGPFDKKGGNYGDRLKRLVEEVGISDKVNFLDSVDGKEKEQLLASANFLVLPSETENFGNVVVEALNQGTPVIASDKTPWQVLEDANCGYFVSNEVGPLSKAIDRLINLSDGEYKEKCTSAYRLVDNKFSIGQGIDVWLIEYNNLLK